MNDLVEKLRAPFDPARVSWRVGSMTGDKSKGMALAYIDSRDVQDRLDAVCGPDGWQDRYPHVGQKTVCEIGIKINDQWIWKSDGAGDSDVEAEKGALSDAFKRAAVKWGIGRYLYDLESPWVEIVQKGRSYVIADKEYPRLRALLTGKAAPEAAHKNKSAPGVSDASTWVSKHVRTLHSAESPQHFMEIIERCRTNWVRVCATFPHLWEGPDGSGLRGEGVKVATMYECRPKFDAFVKAVESDAREGNRIDQQAAE